MKRLCDFFLHLGYGWTRFDFGLINLIVNVHTGVMRQYALCHLSYKGEIRLSLLVPPLSFYIEIVYPQSVLSCQIYIFRFITDIFLLILSDLSNSRIVGSRIAPSLLVVSLIYY